MKLLVLRHDAANTLLRRRRTQNVCHQNAHDKKHSGGCISNKGISDVIAVTSLRRAIIAAWSRPDSTGSHAPCSARCRPD